ncbi:MAG: hypothetical protein QXZ44_03525 [Ferroplasma sp.]
MAKAVKSWLLFKGTAMTRKIKIGGHDTRITLKDEKVPSQVELKKIFLAVDSRGRLACAIMAFTGENSFTIRNVE